MCDPVSAAIVGAAAFGGYTQHKAGKAQQDIANANADAAERQADYAKRVGHLEEDRHRMRVRQMIGRQRAAGAANGIDVSQGSALQLQSDTARFGAEDANTIRANALRQAWGFNVQAADARTQGRLAAYEGTMGGVGTILTGGAQAYGVYKQRKA